MPPLSTGGEIRKEATKKQTRSPRMEAETLPSRKDVPALAWFHEQQLAQGWGGRSVQRGAPSSAATTHSRCLRRGENCGAAN